MALPSVQSSGSITLEIGPPGPVKQFVLTGTVGSQIQVGFRAKDGDPEVPLGSFEQIIESVGKMLGAGAGFATGFKEKLDELEKIDLLGYVVGQLRAANLIVTDLAISAEYKKPGEEEGKYEVTSAAFGFRVEFPKFKLGPVTIRGFGVLFEYTPKDENNGDGVLTTRPR
jgi:hypothetical protein